jgi:hypothetical protein
MFFSNSVGYLLEFISLTEHLDKALELKVVSKLLYESCHGARTDVVVTANDTQISGIKVTLLFNLNAPDVFQIVHCVLN